MGSSFQSVRTVIEHEPRVWGMSGTLHKNPLDVNAFITDQLIRTGTKPRDVEGEAITKNKASPFVYFLIEC